jgi:hypothetical protein
MSWWMLPAAIIGGGIARKGAKSANQETRASTAKQMAFQERMSNTAHQRQVRDLRRAGINPILSAKLGGASTPQGASYTAQNAGLAATQGFQQVSSGISSISSAKQAQAQTTLIGEQARKVRAEVLRKLPAEVRKLDAEGILAQAKVSVSQAETIFKDLTNQILRGDIKALKKLGLSAMQLKHSPTNQIGSIIIDKLMEKAPDILKNKIEPPSLDDKYSRSAR